MNTVSCTKCKLPKLQGSFGFRDASHEKRHRWCRDCVRQYNRTTRFKYRDAKNRGERERRARLRYEVLTRYCDLAEPFCNCCGENTLEFLSLDHVSGGGNQHKKLIGGNLYRWLKKYHFPPGFRVLCHNCNQALGAYGYCPHDAPSQAIES